MRAAKHADDSGKFFRRIPSGAKHAAKKLVPVKTRDRFVSEHDFSRAEAARK
jgi:hypothetical protein